MSAFFEPRTQVRGDTLPNCKEWRTNGNGPATWSPIQVQVFTNCDAGELAIIASDFVARADIQIVGISPVALCQGEPSYADGSGLSYQYAMTVLYQERNVPA